MYSLFLLHEPLSYLALLRRARARRRAALARSGGSPRSCASRRHPYGALVLASQGAYVLLVRAAPARGARRVRRRRRVGIPSGSPTSCSLTASTSASRARTAASSARRCPCCAISRRSQATSARAGRSCSSRSSSSPRSARASSGGATGSAAYLAACVVAVPSAAMLAARLGSGASPETRHLIFVLPFFALALALGVLALARRFGRAVACFAVACAGRRAARLGLREDAAALHRRPARRGSQRATRRRAGSRRPRGPTTSSSGTSRCTSTPGSGTRGVARIVIPRADAKLAAARLRRPARAARSRRVGLRRVRHEQLRVLAKLDDRGAVAASGRRLRVARVRALPRDPHARADARRPRSTSSAPRR